MIEQFKKSIKVIVLGLVIGLSVQLAYSAWSGPSSNPPSGNKAAPINVTVSPQGKGGVPTSGSLLDIHGVLVANQLGVAGDSVFGDLVTVAPLGDAARVKPAPLCADENGTFVLCTLQNNIQVYTLNTSGNQVTSGDCATCTSTQFMNAVDQQVTIRLWAGGGGGGGGGKAHMLCAANEACADFAVALQRYTNNWNTATSTDPSYFFKTQSGGNGNDTVFGAILTANGGIGGEGGGPVCVLTAPTVQNTPRCSGDEVGQYMPNSDGVGGSGNGGGAGASGLSGILDNILGHIPSQIPTVFSMGGSGGGGSSGEFVEQTLTLPAGTYNVVVGKGGAGGQVFAAFASGLSGNATSCPGNQTRANDSFFAKTAHAQIGTGGPTSVMRNGGQGGVPQTISGTFGRGGGGGATENCSDTIDSTGSALASKANHGLPGYGGRIEVLWDQL